MKIALMTWFHYINYGTALQVYASTKYLEEKGNEVYVVQYYPNPSPMYFSSKSSEYLYRAKRKLHKISTSKGILDETCSESFHNFISSSIRLTEKVQNESDFAALNSKFDCFICGSDQIWSPLNYDPHYFLDFVTDPSKMIAYAPSMGVSHIEQPGLDEQISKLTNRFRYLSVRENTGARIIQELNGREAKVVLDPTLLLDNDDWEQCIPGKIDGKYLLVYFLRENKKYWKVVKEVADRLHLGIKVIPVFEDDLRMSGAQKDAGPDDFVRLVRGASFVCTDSFHGMAFSVNFNKQFLPFKRFPDKAADNQNSRVIDFLDSVGLRDRLYDGGKPDISNIDYGAVKEKLEGLRIESRKYLDGALNAVLVSERD